MKHSLVIGVLFLSTTLMYAADGKPQRPDSPHPVHNKAAAMNDVGDYDKLSPRHRTAGEASPSPKSDTGHGLNNNSAKSEKAVLSDVAPSRGKGILVVFAVIAAVGLFEHFALKPEAVLK